MNGYAPSSVLSLFNALCKVSPDKPILTFVDDRGRDHESVTACQLATAAENIAGMLHDRGLRRGDRLLLAYPTSIEFVKAFLACLIAKLIPVPVCAPSMLTFDVDMTRLNAIAAACGAAAILTNTECNHARQLKAMPNHAEREKNGLLPWYCTDQLSEHEASFQWDMPDSEETAFIQFTSGSTGAPKGVVISHRNLHDDILANMRATHVDEQSHAVIWLPQYHDMGLGIILSAVVGKIRLHFMSPLTFLRRPAVWFDVIARVHATHTVAPNFALDLAVRKTTPEMRQHWDLRSLRSLLCAAEPIRVASIQAFAQAFTPSGFLPAAFYTAYGLAEHTLSVAFRQGIKILRLDKACLHHNRVVPLDATRADEPGIDCISCGSIDKPDARMRIVDPDTGLRCAPDSVGEIWLHSSTKAQGYYLNEPETNATFRAHIAHEADETVYLRTGDLGFLHEGELYVTGRCKDLIVIHGRNLYPQDIEHSVRDCHPWIRPNGIVAFPYDDVARGECVALLIETREAFPDPLKISSLLRAIRRTVMESHQIVCNTIILSRSGIRKTTSGKVRRNACKQAYLSGELQQVATTICIDTLAGMPAVVPGNSALVTPKVSHACCS